MSTVTTRAAGRPFHDRRVGGTGGTKYLKCAAGVFAGKPAPNTYWYYLGYPLLGAFFYRLMPQHLFLIPNLTLVVGTANPVLRDCEKFISSLEAVLFLRQIFAICYRGTAVGAW
jgi:hypothetical protein